MAHTAVRSATRSRDELRRTASEAFGWPELRSEQLEAMESLLAGQDVLVVMPTGSGKSAIYQVPGLLMDGPTVVVSPLIALQRDQVTHLDRADAAGAVTINSAETARATDRAWDAVDRGRAEYLSCLPSSWPRTTSSRT